MSLGDLRDLFAVVKNMLGATHGNMGGKASRMMSSVGNRFQNLSGFFVRAVVSKGLHDAHKRSPQDSNRLRQTDSESLNARWIWPLIRAPFGKTRKNDQPVDQTFRSSAAFNCRYRLHWSPGNRGKS